MSKQSLVCMNCEVYNPDRYVLKNGYLSKRCKLCKSELWRMTERKFEEHMAERRQFELECELRKLAIRTKNIENKRQDNSMPRTTNGNPKTSRVYIRPEIIEDFPRCDCPYWGTEFE